MRKTSHQERVGISAAVLVAVALAGCGGNARVSDTGYAGTWVRGNERIRSTLAIVRDGDRFRTRIGVRSSDGTYAIRAGWEGAGEEVQDGAKTYVLVYRTTVDPATAHLRVECTGTPAVPSRKPMRYVDELVVEPGGLTLSAYTLERDGQRYEGDARPRREFRKASDEVKDPPPAGRAP